MNLCSNSQVETDLEPGLKGTVKIHLIQNNNLDGMGALHSECITRKEVRVDNMLCYNRFDGCFSESVRNGV